MSAAVPPVPDAVEPLEYWRGWNYDCTTLLSPLQGDRWLPGVAFEATCARGHDNLEWAEVVRYVDGRRYVVDVPVPEQTWSVPAEHCTCGIYALSERAALGRIMGKVNLWGRVIRGSRGARAQYGYPSVLYVPPSLADDPGLRAYGVPLVEDTSLAPSFDSAAGRRRSRFLGLRPPLDPQMIEWLRAHPDTGIARTLLPLLGGDDDDDPPDAGAAVLAA